MLNTSIVSVITILFLWAKNSNKTNIEVWEAITSDKPGEDTFSNLVCYFIIIKWEQSSWKQKFEY